MIGIRHLCGTDPRSRHFSSARGPTPSDVAISATKFQSNVVLMRRQYSDKSSESQRQIGGRRKRLNSLPYGLLQHEVIAMAEEDHIDNEETAIRQRAKQALRAYRESRGWSMREMAVYLGVPAKSYERYESDASRGVPAGVIARFCRFTDTDLNWIMLGKKQARKAG